MCNGGSKLLSLPGGGNAMLVRYSSPSIAGILGGQEGVPGLGAGRGSLERGWDLAGASITRSYP